MTRSRRIRRVVGPEASGAPPLGRIDRCVDRSTDWYRWVNQLIILAGLQDRKERLLGNLNSSDLLHALFAGLLLFKQKTAYEMPK